MEIGKPINGIVTLATFTCQPREAVIGRRQENQWLGELQLVLDPSRIRYSWPNVTTPVREWSAAAISAALSHPALECDLGSLCRENPFPK